MVPLPLTGLGSLPHTGLGSLPHTGLGSLPHTRLGSLPHTGLGSLPHTRLGSLPHTGLGSLPLTRLLPQYHVNCLASYPGSRLIKCVREVESIHCIAVQTGSRAFLGLRFSPYTLSHHARMDDIISCQVSIKSYCSF